MITHIHTSVLRGSGQRRCVARVLWRFVMLVASLALAACASSGSSGTTRSTAAAEATSARPLTVGSGPAEAVIQAHLEAYNRRDLAAFMATLAPDVRMYQFPDSLLYSGRDTLRAVYGRLFERATGLDATITHRFVQGRFVVDRGITTGLPGQAPITDVEIFEVRDGLITRIWFLDP